MRAKISDVALMTEKFDFFFGICLEVLFRHIDNLSKALQKKYELTSKEHPLASMVKSTLISLHSYASFELFWESVNAKSQLLEIYEPRLPKKENNHGTLKLAMLQLNSMQTLLLTTGMYTMNL